MILHIVPCDFGVDEIDRQQAVFLPAMGEAWYWYCEGDWEGTGEMIGWLPNECLGISPNLHLDEAIGWFYHNMGHCSCYGPTENFDNEVTAHEWVKRQSELLTGQFRVLTEGETVGLYQDGKTLLRAI